jgi:Tol biopolymer transport system component
MRPAKVIQCALASAACLGASLAAPGAASALASARIVFTAERKIERIAPGGGGRRVIAPAPRKTADLAATDDGRWIAVLSNRGAPGPSPRAVHTDHLRQIYLIGPGGRMRAVLPRPIRTSAGDSIAISRDGRLIAFGRENEIWVVRANGSHIRQITSGDQGTALDPAFMPDGRSLVFSRYIGLSRAQLYGVSVSGGVERPIPAAGTWALAATVSPSGLIAYLGHGPRTTWQLRTIRIDGSGRRSIYRPHGGAAMYTPDFSPDGRRIVVVSGRGADWDRRHYSLATVRVGGGDRRVVLAGLRDHHSSPQWTR